jgi:hypothetical protein
MDYNGRNHRENQTKPERAKASKTNGTKSVSSNRNNTQRENVRIAGPDNSIAVTIEKGNMRLEGSFRFVHLFSAGRRSV